MNSLSTKMSNFSIYDVRKVARTAQNSLFASNSPIELMIRTATNTDSWGPSTKQLEEIQHQLVFDDPEEVFDLIFRRIVEYLGTGSRFDKKKQSFYNRAVHYVNSGNEWKIISKSLKLIEFLILHSGDEYVPVIQDHRGVLKRVLDAYEYEDGSSAVVTTLELERKEHAKSITKSVTNLLKLLDEEDYRNTEVAKALRTSKLGSVGNDAVVFKNRNGGLSGFKTKRMDSSKVQNSNAKSEIRNQLGHVIHVKKRLPGNYSMFGSNSNGQLYDPEEADADYNTSQSPDDPYNDSGTYGDSRNEVGAFKDNLSSESLGAKDKETDEGVDLENDHSEEHHDDEFGDFQTTPITPQTAKFSSSVKEKQHDALLLSFEDEPNTPTNPTSSTFDSFFMGLESPGSSKPPTSHLNESFTNINAKPSETPKPKDSFASLFQTAKGTSN